MIGQAIKKEVDSIEKTCEVCNANSCKGCKMVIELFGKKITIRGRDKKVLKIE